MKGGGQTLWNAIAFCEVSRTSWQMGKRHTKGDLENHSKANNIFWSSGWILSVFTKRLGDNSSNLQEGITRNLSGQKSWSREEFEKERSWLHTWKIWKSWMHQIFISKQAQWTSSSTQRAFGRNIHYSIEMYWCCEFYSHWFGCVARKEDWRLLECRSSKHLSDSWRGFTKFTLLKKEASKRIRLVWGRLTKIQTITRPDFCIARRMDENR